jgi:membrane-bound ClpP family serine protease
MGKEMTLITIESVSIVIALTIIIILCTFLVFHENYEDGVIGRLALGLLVFGALMMLARMFGAREGWSTEIDPAGELMIYGCAAFLCRHTYRFLRALHDPNFHWHRSTSLSSPPQGKPE